MGLHFFSPANIMKLLEIVVPAKVSADVVATGFELAKKLQKGAGARRCVRRLHRQPHPGRLQAGRRLHDGRRRQPLRDRRGVRGFGYPWARTR
jgi:3-hydroxyacyl-CoA dehydrogenase